MQQHIISEWLLKAFARRGPDGGPVLDAYNKADGHFEVVTPAEFMVEHDAHSAEVEQSISTIEGPAAQAARRLSKRVKSLPPGLYAVVPPGADVRATGPELSDMGVVEGMRLLVSQRRVPSPHLADRIALANYAGLMYQRAPITEAAFMRFGVAYDAGAQAALDVLRPGMVTGLQTEIRRRRSRMAGLAREVGGQLTDANWFIVRPGAGETFVLGDSPVAATLSLGHADMWRPILSPGAYAIVMPLSPTVALVMAPKGIVPITASDVDGATQAINQLIWRWADRYVLAGGRASLEATWPDDESRRSSVPVDEGAGSAGLAARGDVSRIIIRLVRWRWDACRLEFGLQWWAAEGRSLQPEIGAGHTDMRTLNR
jgi:hypothetical protein